MARNKNHFYMNEFENNIVNNWKKLQTDETFSDVTLACDENIIKAHSIVIASGSLVLQKILANSNKNTIIFLNSVNYDDLKNVINFLYQGEVNIPEECLGRFLETADNLKIMGLMGKNEEYSSTRINSSILSFKSNAPSKFNNPHIIDNYVEISAKDMPDDEQNSDSIPIKSKQEFFSLTEMKMKEEINCVPFVNNIYNGDNTIFDNLKVIGLLENKYSNERISSSTLNLNGNFSSEIINPHTITNNEDVVTKDIPASCEFNDAEQNLDSFSKKNKQELIHFSEIDMMKEEISGAPYVTTDKGDIVEFNKARNCSQCDFNTILLKDLISHINIEHEGKYSCEQCNYISKSRRHFKLHVLSIHSGRTYSCDQCNFSSKFKTTLKDHIKSMHEDIYYFCDQCNHKTKHYRNLKYHIQAAHLNTSYQCTQCTYVGNVKTQLNRHMKAEHEGVHYSCQECDYKAKINTNLKLHVLRVHGNEKFLCSECAYEGKSHTDLKRHSRSMHEGACYPCTQCDYKAKNSTHLKRHTESIHELIRYYCEMCEFKASRKDNLSQHINSIHNKK